MYIQISPSLFAQLFLNICFSLIQSSWCIDTHIVKWSMTPFVCLKTGFYHISTLINDCGMDIFPPRRGIADMFLVSLIQKGFGHKLPSSSLEPITNPPAYHRSRYIHNIYPGFPFIMAL